MTAKFCLPERFKVRLTMLSDWHVGSGTGHPGHIDRLIVRDADGLPFVPAKTLHGIWRDACELLCRGLDNGKEGRWSGLVDYIFGSQPSVENFRDSGTTRQQFGAPLPASFRVRPAHLVPSLREVLAHADRRIMEALTFIKPGVAIDRRSGAAKSDYLRFEEMARIHTPLEADCFLRVPDKMRETVSALLIASAKLVERLGGKRRRGAGRCRLEISPDGLSTTSSAAGSKLSYHTLLEAVVDYLRTHPEPPEWPMAVQEGELARPSGERPAATTPISVAVELQQQSTDAESQWICVPLKLTLQGPLAVTYRTTGNVVTSLDHLPGFYLLPHVTRVLPDLRPAVPAGDVVVLPAYPEVNGERGEPVPLAFFQVKDEPSNRTINRLLETPPEKQLKQVRDGYIARSCPSLPFNTPLMMLTHNAVLDAKQRPDEQTGGVYSYEAIAPKIKHQGQTRPLILRSELRVRKNVADRLSSSLGTDWWNQLSGTTALGRSKKDDYGNVQLTAETPYCLRCPSTEDSQNRVQQKDVLENAPLTAFMWIVSDTLLRNDQLRFEATPEILANYLSTQLGIPLRVRNSRTDSTPGQGTLLDVLVRPRRLEPWHVGWGLPRPSLVAIQAGSCLVLQSTAPVNGQDLSQVYRKLRELEITGIGERTAEGFGQVRFDDPVLTQPQVSNPKSEGANTHQTNSPAQAGAPSDKEKSAAAATGRIIKKDDDTFSYARLVECECWKQEIRRAALGIASQKETRQRELCWAVHNNSPPMSQLGALRGQLARLHSHQHKRAVLDWISHLRSNPRRKEKWPEKALDFAENILNDSNKIWEILQAAQFPTITEDARQELQDELWPFAVRTFFDACVRAHKRDLEQTNM